MSAAAPPPAVSASPVVRLAVQSAASSASAGRSLSVTSRSTQSALARSQASLQQRGGKGRAGNSSGSGEGPASAASAAFSSSTSRLTLPPRPSSASGGGGISSRRPVPRVTLADRGVLTDVDYIADWLLSVRQSGQLQTFAPIIARLKKAIFTPEQVRRHKQSPAQQQAQSAVQRGGRHTHSSSASAAKEHSEFKEQPSHSHSHGHTASASAIDTYGSRVLPAQPRVGSYAVSGASTSSSSSPAAPSAASASPAASSHASSASTSPLSSSPRSDSAAAGVDPSDALDLDEDDEWDEKVALFSRKADRQQSEQDRHSSRQQHRQQQPSLVPVGVQFVHGRWVAAGTAPVANTQASAAATAVPLSASTTSPSSSPSAWSGAGHSVGGGSVDGSTSPPSASLSSRLLSDASDSQPSTPDLLPSRHKADEAAFPDDLDSLPEWEDDTAESAHKHKPDLSAWSSAQSGIAPAPLPVPVVPSSPSLSLQSTASSVSALSSPPPADDFDELDSIPDFDQPTASAAAAADASGAVGGGVGGGGAVSALLASKMAEFPDDMTVVELKEIDDQASTADDNATDADTDDDAIAQSQLSSLPAPTKPTLLTADWAAPTPSQLIAAPLVPSSAPSSSSSAPASRLSLSTASRLHSRLLRVSMGGAEQFPADIDELPDDSAGHAQPAAAAHSAAANAQPAPRPSPSSDSSRSGSTTATGAGSSWLPLTPASSAPSARVLNEFALPSSLVAAFQQQEAAHIACAHPTPHSHSQSVVAAHGESKSAQLLLHSRSVAEQQPVLSRELQLRFILTQAETAPYAFHTNTHSRTAQSQQQQRAQASSAASKGGGSNDRASAQSAAATGAAPSEFARLRIPSTASARKKDGWTASS